MPVYREALFPPLRGVRTPFHSGDTTHGRAEILHGPLDKMRSQCKF
jgi:hypothetical protein